MFNKSLYVVVIGRGIGIFRSWDKVKGLINRYSNAKHKKFSTFKEANDYFKENTGLWLRVADIDREFNCINEAREFIFNRLEKEKKQKELNENVDNVFCLFDNESTKERKDELDDLKPITIISLDEVDKIGF